MMKIIKGMKKREWKIISSSSRRRKKGEQEGGKRTKEDGRLVGGTWERNQEERRK